MDGNENARGTTKLLKCLSKNHEKAFEEVAQAEGLSVSGVLDNMWSDVQVSKKQSLKIFQHLQVGLNAKIQCHIPKLNAFMQDSPCHLWD